MAIDVKPFVELAEARRGRTHFEGCEHYHASCAILYLAGALDAAQKRLDEYKAEIERLNNLLADATSVAREGVAELLDALHTGEITQQEIIAGFKEYFLGNVESRICSYCGLVMSGDEEQQMTDHVMQCTSNPLVQEIERLRAELAAHVEGNPVLRDWNSPAEDEAWKNL